MIPHQHTRLAVQFPAPRRKTNKHNLAEQWSKSPRNPDGHVTCRSTQFTERNEQNVDKENHLHGTANATGLSQHIALSHSKRHKDLQDEDTEADYAANEQTDS